jgi:antitoxin component of MazEF toxin-antitoxin module
MGRRKVQDRNVRKLSKYGSSYTITLPVEMVRELGWKNKQKLVVKKTGSKLTIEDWKK